MIPGIVAQAAPGSAAPAGPGVTVLLVGFGGTVGSQDIKEEGALNLPITPIGNVSISDTQSKFGGTSGYFDGVDDALSFPFNEGFEFGTGEFLIDGWFYSTASGARSIIAQRTSGAAASNTWSVSQISSSGNRLEFAFYTASATGVTIVSSGTFTLNAWHHFAVARGADGFIRMFIDGVFQGSVEEAGQAWTTKRFPVFIGNVGDLGVDFTGYLDEIRIVKGDAIYQTDSNFTPPATANARPTQASLVPDADANYADVLLLLGFDDAEQYTVRDTGPDNRTMAFRFNPGSYSVPTPKGIGRRRSEFFSAGSFLAWDDNADWAFGTDQFTVEGWVRDSSYNAFQHIIGQRAADSAANTAWVLTTLTSDGGLELIASNGSTVSQFGSGTQTLHLNAWNHFALTRDASGVFRIFVNGIMCAKDTTKTTLAIQNLAARMTIGAKADGSNPLTGYLDEIRVTRGFCRYATDDSFWPSLKPFSRGESGPPVFTVDPSISSVSGFYAVGDVLVLDIGTADGYDPVIQWRRDGVNLGGATSTTYTLQALDEGAEIDATVTRWNYSGTTTATADAVGPVAGDPVYATGALAPHGDMQDGTDRLIPSGDMQTGGDVLLWKERTT
jgi:hypothetical protein